MHLFALDQFKCKVLEIYEASSDDEEECGDRMLGGSVSGAVLEEIASS